MLSPIKKIIYRTYQAAFHLAIPLLPYRKPEKISDLPALVQLLKKKSIRSVMIVTGKIVRSIGLTEPLEALLEESGISCTIYDSTVANPTTDNVAAALELYKENNCECLIGFGGGSPIDCAKAVGACVVRPDKTLAQMKGLLKIHRKLPLLVAIPTTAGTGTETTVSSVITDAATRVKYPMNDFSLIPHYAVLDAQVTRSLSPSLTATTGMDALTHAVEAYIGRSTTRQSRADAIEAVQLIFQYLPLAYRDGNDMEARKKMLYASYLAGSAFTVSYVGYVHAVAHSLGGLYNVPHGFANAVLLPVVLKSYGEKAYKKLHQLAICIGAAAPTDSHEKGATAFIHAIEQLKKELEIGDTISGIQTEDIPLLARHAAAEANPLYPVPKLMDAGELEAIFYQVQGSEKRD